MRTMVCMPILSELAHVLLREAREANAVASRTNTNTRCRELCRGAHARVCEVQLGRHAGIMARMSCRKLLQSTASNGGPFCGTHWPLHVLPHN